jgi:putative CocE/NonD family hydrolase
VRRALVAALLGGAVLAPAAHAAQVTQPLDFRASDGVRLKATIGGQDEIRPRPTIIEFSPYAPGCCAEIAGPEYNYVQVQARGTGASEGRWSATGPRDQQDVSDFLRWACDQPWSGGEVAIYGFSASAIVAYNAMHLDLACMRTAVLMAGGADLYRDLLYIGGIPNMIPGTAVLAAIGAGALASGPERMRSAPQTAPDPPAGYLQIGLDFLAHPTLDGYWNDRTLRPTGLHVPILADTGFYDVESRGPFEAYRLTRHLGSHLLVLGAHDGWPADSGGPFPHYKRWFDHYLLGIDNGVQDEPRVQTLFGIGGREALMSGAFKRASGDDWPLPQTRWTALHLGDGTITPEPVSAPAEQTFVSTPSQPLASDPNTVATVGGSGWNGYTLDDLIYGTGLGDMNAPAPLAATYTTPPLAEAADAVGPLRLHVRLTTTTPESDVHAVIADVGPDGQAKPVGLGRLRTSFPGVIEERSLFDPASGEMVRPYPDFSVKTPATPGEARDYDIEFWPIGNRFEAGHRIRLYLTGSAALVLPTTPSATTVSVGGDTAARLVFPTLDAPPVFAADR